MQAMGAAAREWQEPRKDGGRETNSQADRENSSRMSTASSEQRSRPKPSMEEIKQLCSVAVSSGWRRGEGERTCWTNEHDGRLAAWISSHVDEVEKTITSARQSLDKLVSSTKNALDTFHGEILGNSELFIAIVFALYCISESLAH